MYMCIEHSNERPEGVQVSKACGCRGLVGIEGVVEGVGIAALRVHGHECTHSCVHQENSIFLNAS